MWSSSSVGPRSPARSEFSSSATIAPVCVVKGGWVPPASWCTSPPWPVNSCVASLVVSFCVRVFTGMVSPLPAHDHGPSRNGPHQHLRGGDHRHSAGWLRCAGKPTCCLVDGRRFSFHVSFTISPFDFTEIGPDHVCCMEPCGLKPRTSHEPPINSAVQPPDTCLSHQNQLRLWSCCVNDVK